MRYLYVGSVNDGNASVRGNGEGIYVIRVEDDLNMEVTDIRPAANAGILSEFGNVIYAANEVRNFTGLPGSGGGVSAYAMEGDHLKLLNCSLSYGSRPCFTAADWKYLFVSNHGSHSAVTTHYINKGKSLPELERIFDDSSVAMFALNKDGSIGELSDLHVIKGSGYWCYGGGQSTSHIHSVRAKGRYVYACNRGCDEIDVFEIVNGFLILRNRFETRPAMAPRHFVFHPEKELLYVAFENYPAAGVYAVQGEKLKELQILGTAEASYYETRPLPEYGKRHAEEGETNTCSFADKGALMPADIHITSDGKYVFVSNRSRSGNASISSFAVQEDGTLKLLAVRELDGQDPRGFEIMDDRYLVIGLLDRNVIQIHPLENGIVMDAVAKVSVGAPASVVVGDVIAENDENEIPSKAFIFRELICKT
ncbi:MAG: beta-propeller fold lactonase family protein [Solobacterium sp.]|nr:beta-propeller fold lactonase family protein [Solobacterium sp.]